MPRITPIEATSATGRVKEIYEGPLKGKTFNIFRSMAASPAALDMYLAMSGSLHKGSLSAKEIEAIQLTVGEQNKCEYCVSAHTAIGKMSGLTEAQTIEARRGAMSDAKLGALVKFALALHDKRGLVSDGDIASLRAAGYGDAALADIVACYTLAVYTNYFNHVNQTVSDFPPVVKV